MNLVTVVIPIYKGDLTPYEQISFDSIYTTLGRNHKITIVKPESLDISFLTSKYENMLIETFNDSYFKNIAGYNKLMLSVDFYRRFEAYKYILIAQTDCYIFRDELEQWCNKDYDYIGAPWLIRPRYKFPLLRLCTYLKRRYCRLTNRPNSQISKNKVGNGGLSLRKVSSHIAVATELKEVADYYLNYPRRNSIFNEDVFWAIEPEKSSVEFKYPPILEALHFSIDQYPKYSTSLLEGKRPMGCHGWYKRKMIGYWKNVILTANK